MRNTATLYLKLDSIGPAKELGDVQRWLGEINDIVQQIEEQGESVAEADKYNRIRSGISGVKALKDDLDDWEKELQQWSWSSGLRSR